MCCYTVHIKFEGGVRNGKRGKLTLNYCVILNEYVYGDKYCINKEK